MSLPNDKAWQAAMSIITALRVAGHSALLAGGCVRDRLLGLRPQDYDVATDAVPARVIELFPKARQVGAKFGVVLIHRMGCDTEVATFRSDGAYSDGRHPDAVRFGTEVEDAQRRDFTINGLFFDPVEDRVIDHVGGRADLDAGIIRTIGDPLQRFSEDHLRLLRAVRFAARFGFRIDASTMSAIQSLAEKLPSISVERIWMELEQILTAPSRLRGWLLLLETRLRNQLSPRWTSDALEDRRVEQRLGQLPIAPIPEDSALATVLCERPPPEVSAICHSLKLSNTLSRNVAWLVAALPRIKDESSLDLADLKILMADPCWTSLLELLRADLAASQADPGPYERVAARASAIPQEAVAPPPLLTGDDLHAMNVPLGPGFGRILKAVHRAQLNEQIRTRDDATALARKMLAEIDGGKP